MGGNEFGETVASGLYFYTLTAGDFSATRKMVIPEVGQLSKIDMLYRDMNLDLTAFTELATLTCQRALATWIFSIFYNMVSKILAERFITRHVTNRRNCLYSLSTEYKELKS